MDAIAGFYGKFPQLGDFVNRRLPNEFIDPWDGWLQEAVATSKQQLGESWLEHYLTSPIWRFVLSAGLCGQYPWYGLVMPSVDRVGRYFPLTIACRLELDSNPIAIAMSGSAWFEIAEEIMLDALETQGFNLENFDSRVTGLGSLTESSVAQGYRSDVGFGSAWQIPTEYGQLDGSLACLLHQLAYQRLGAYSMWWSAGSDQVEPSMLVSGGLPKSTGFSSLLNGDWSTGDWEQWSPPENQLSSAEFGAGPI